MAALLRQPTMLRARPLHCAPARHQPPAIGQRTPLALRTWSSPASDLARSRRTLLGCDDAPGIAAPGSRALQQGLQPACAIGPRLFATSPARRAPHTHTQSGGPPGDRTRDQTPQPKKPLIEKTKELRKQLKSLSTHEKIWNVPNVLTFSRLVAAPVVGYLILHDQHAWALGLFAYAGITDMVDGWIARRWQLQTVVGSVVDPMADKLLMAITVGCLAAKGALPGPLAILIFGRDASLAVAAIYYRYASLPSPKTFARYWDFSLPSAEVHPTTVSKFNTFLQIALIGLTLLFPVLANSSDHDAIPNATVSDSFAAERGRAASADPSGPAVATASSPTSSAEFSKPAVPPQSQPLHTKTLYAATDAGNLSKAVTALQVMVGATTVWSGFSYAVLKDAVTILGSNEALKQRQGARGRAIIGASFALICAGAIGWAAKDRQGDEKEKRDDR